LAAVTIIPSHSDETDLFNGRVLWLLLPSKYAGAKDRAHDCECLHGHKRREERSCRTAMQRSESWSASCRVLEPAERKCRHANLRAAVCSPLASGKHSGQRERRCFT